MKMVGSEGGAGGSGTVKITIFLKSDGFEVTTGGGEPS